MDVKVAMEHIRRGPKGGNLDMPYNPTEKTAWKKEHFNGEVLANGELSLHRFNKEFVETTNPGKKNEQPWHRMAAYMLNAGRTNSEIALAAGIHPTQVSQLRAQRWFQELLATIANTEGGEILGLVRSEAAASVEKLVELRDTSESDRVQLAAATTLLEHSHGKPVQKTISFSASTSFSSPADEMEQIDEELKALRQQSPEIPAVKAVVK